MVIKELKFIVFVFFLFCASCCYAQSSLKRDKSKDASRNTQVISKSNRNADRRQNNGYGNNNSSSNNQYTQQPIKFEVMIDSKIHQISIINGHPDDLKRYTLDIGAYSNFDNAVGCAKRYGGFLIYDYTKGMYLVCVGNTDNMSEMESMKNYFSSQYYLSGIIIYKYGY